MNTRIVMPCCGQTHISVLPGPDSYAELECPRCGKFSIPQSRIIEDVSTKFQAIGLGLEQIEIDAPLGIKITHNNKSYTLKENNQGELILSSLGDQLILKPSGSNTVKIEAWR